MDNGVPRDAAFATDVKCRYIHAGLPVYQTTRSRVHQQWIEATPLI